ncbi:MAG TPA: DinB family protein [Acidobacteriaceae bacterium]|jgi:hypothetical protein|nr:DinB family protein [Acidobacteriaceae bacterium]
MPNLEDNLALLARTPATLDALLRDLPPAWTLANEGDATWTARDVVAHLAQLERSDWMPRLRHILAFADTRPFDPVDRTAFQHSAEGKTLPHLLDEFARLRHENLDAIRGLSLAPASLARKGRHPSLGPVTLSQLIAAWAVHDLTHLHQIARILAHQNREAVGPWSKFLGVLHCAGHGASA